MVKSRDMTPSRICCCRFECPSLFLILSTGKLLVTKYSGLFVLNNYTNFAILASQFH